MLDFDIKTPQQLKRLAQSSIWGAGVLTFCLTPAGYLYAGRNKLALITLVIWLPLFLASEIEAMSGLMGFFIIGATIENVTAIHRAKAAVKQQGIHTQHEEDASRLTITLLKLAQEKGEITMADCVIKTEKTPEEIRTILLELEQQDLLRTANRASDGAVVYRLV